MLPPDQMLLALVIVAKRKMASSISKKEGLMDFIHWMLVAEDVIIALVILAFLYLRKIPYTIISIINASMLIFVNILLFQKSNNEYFLTLPIITCIITTLIARSFVPQRRSEWNVKTTKIVTTAFVISAIILIVISFILAFKLL